MKVVELENGRSRTYVSVDGGMSDNIRPALYAAEYSCALANRATEADPVLARVVGKHCEGGDILIRDVFLPRDIHPGDLIAVPGSGAYSDRWPVTTIRFRNRPLLAVRRGGDTNASQA